MRTRASRIFCILNVLSVAILSGCNKDNDCDCVESPPSASPAPVAEKKADALPQVTGKWSGRWESETHKGHGGGGLTCEAIESGPQKWEATFVAEFGKTKSYKVKLEGTPGEGKVIFGGKVDLGKEDGGEFTWTGKATETEFTGDYEGGGDKGSFKMTRPKP